MTEEKPEENIADEEEEEKKKNITEKHLAIEQDEHNKKKIAQANPNHNPNRNSKDEEANKSKKIVKEDLKNNPEKQKIIDQDEHNKVIAVEEAACRNEIAEKQKAILVKEQELLALETKRIEVQSQQQTNEDFAGYTCTTTCKNTSEELKKLDDNNTGVDTGEKGRSEVLKTGMLKRDATTAEADIADECDQCKVISMCNDACMHH